jgi:hypothetical protein
VKGVLVDLHGRPITSPQAKEKAEFKLRDFMEKYRSRFQDWFTEYGPTAKPPIRYDLNKEEWFWLE